MPPKGSKLPTKPVYLLIAEKASLMNEIMAVFNHGNFPYDLIPRCARGHLMTLKLPSELGCGGYGFEYLPFFNDKWEYKPIDETKEMLKEIKETYKKQKINGIIHAGDPGPEGELIVREIIDFIGVKCPVYRFWTNSLMESDISNALSRLPDVSQYDRVYNCALARQRADYDIGMNFSAAMSDKLKTVVAVGRVMTYIQGLIFKREMEIENFKDEINYGINAEFTKGNDTFKGILVDSEDLKQIKFETKQDALDTAQLNVNPCIVKKVATKGIESAPAAFYKLSTLQIEATKYGFSMDRTLNIAQSLYQKKYVTYPRTNCECINGNEDLDALLETAKRFLDVGVVPDKQRVLSNKKYTNPKALEGEDHSALIPTGAYPQNLTADEKKIFSLICRRFLAPFLDNAKSKKTIAIIESGDNFYKAEGQMLISAGYKVLYESEKMTDLPKLQEGDECIISASIAELHKQKPGLLTESELLKILDNPLKFVSKGDERYKTLKDNGFIIGTQASRPGIIKKLINKGYINLNKGRYSSTEKGRQIIEAIGLDFPLMDVLYTGNWEIKLKQIQDNEITKETFEKEIRGDIVDILEYIKSKNYKQVIAGENSTYACPKCGKILKAVPGRLMCDCGFILWTKTYGKTLTERQKGMLLGGEVVHLKGLVWEGKKFEGDFFLDKNDFKVKKVQQESFI